MSIHSEPGFLSMLSINKNPNPLNLLMQSDEISNVKVVLTANSSHPIRCVLSDYLSGLISCSHKNTEFFFIVPSVLGEVKSIMLQVEELQNIRLICMVFRFARNFWMLRSNSTDQRLHSGKCSCIVNWLTIYLRKVFSRRSPRWTFCDNWINELLI